ncbi:hypothetical protein [Mitsuaria sp. GD03876]|uniref:hypothetical protein n=1 Tax=Mitsuaria sp. GD03876 TaxID=2975399 RepID=UPI002448162C|nr:hypothetical protein [Mitsuaria sp. GD03876]MDH0867309.1 hypothetical protein [Mitsuaria sp. GD03876]
MPIKSWPRHAAAPTPPSLASIVGEHQAALHDRLRHIKTALQSWPPPAHLTRAELPVLEERHGRLEREMAFLAKSPDGPRTAHRLMVLGAEAEALAAVVAPRPSAASPVPDPARPRFRAPHQAPIAQRPPAAASSDPRQLGAATQARVLADIGVIRHRLDALERRDDARYTSSERAAIHAQLGQSQRVGHERGADWPQAALMLQGAKTWLARLEGDLAKLDAFPGGWRSLDIDRRALDPVSRQRAEQRAFRAARLMTATGCDPREAMAMARRVGAAVEARCPETSALLNEQVRRALDKYPAGLVDPLVRMLRFTGTADVADGIAVLRPMMRLPAALTERLAQNGIKILPSPGGLSEAAPWTHGRPVGELSEAFFDPAGRSLVIPTVRDPRTGAVRVEDVVTPLHEAAHAYVHAGGPLSHREARFLAARERDVAQGHLRPGHDEYYLRSLPGLDNDPKEETHVESLAMFLVGDRRWPALHAYWTDQLGAGRTAGSPGVTR